jgi:4-hydroxybenzoate polyprenyltransferase
MDNVKNPGGNSATDIPAETWIDHFVPEGLRPYFSLARADRPIGTWLLLLPCWWSVAMAGAGWPDLRYLVLFAAGALIMRGAGCTVNDIIDRDYDKLVARTAGRPIAGGAVSLIQAFGFLALMLAAGLLILVQFNAFSVMIGAASLVLVVVYPFMKRITYWPQAVLGLTFNWGALLGWTAVRGELSAPALAIYAAGFFWTLGYDTIYAHQDKEDDALIGLKSTALKLGEDTRAWLFGFYAATAALLALAGYLAGLGWPFYPLLGLAALHLIWQAVATDTENPKDCLGKFKSNRDFGLIVFVAVVAGRVVA